MSHKICNFLLAVFATLVPRVGKTAHPDTVPVIAEIPIPGDIGTGVLHVSPSGTFVVCTQSNVPSGQGQLRTKLVVINLASKTIVSSLDLDQTHFEFAVSDKFVFLANNSKLELQVRSIQNVEQVEKTIKLESKLEKLLMLPGPLLCTANGGFRFDCESLEISKKWAPYGSRFMPIQQFHDGWLINFHKWVVGRKSSDYHYVTNRMPQDLRTRAPALLERLGVVDSGPVFPERVWVNAKSIDGVDKDAVAYYVLSCVPKDQGKKVEADTLEKEKLAAERRIVEQTKLVQDEAKAAAEARMQRETEDRNATISRITTPLLQLLYVFGVPTLVVFPFCAAAIRAENPMRFRIAVTLGIIAFLPLLYCFWNFLPLLGNFKIHAGVNLLTLFAAAFFSILAYPAATVIAMVSKGYHLAMGILLSPLGMLGLIIVLLLPSRVPSELPSAPIGGSNQT